MAGYCCQLLLHLGIIICLSLSLSGNTVNQTIHNQNTSTLNTSTEVPSNHVTDTTTSPSESTTTPSTAPPDITNESSTRSPSTTTVSESTEEVVEKETSKVSVTTDKVSSQKEEVTTGGETVSKDLTKFTSIKPTPSTAATSLPTSPSTTFSTPSTSAASSQAVESITEAKGISVVKIQGQKKRLSLADIANKQVVTTSTQQPTTNKPSRKTKPKKKKKRKPSRQPKKQKGSTETPKAKTKKTSTSTSGDEAKPAGPEKELDQDTVKSPLTTVYPMSPDTTIQVHPVEADVKPIVFSAAAADKKNEKKGGKKGSKKNGKFQGKKGEPGPPGPPGPKGPKGEPGDAATSSMPMQAASSAVLTEHFGPDKDVIVPFDLKLIDLADNYDNTTGVFICTIPGVYVVSLYLMSHPGAKVNARVFINSRPIAALWADDSKNSGFYPSSSIQTVSRLAFGDQVYVMLVDGGYGESWVHANYNAFSLFLLYEDIFFK